MHDVHPGQRGNRVLGMVFGTGTLVLLGGLGLLTAVLVTQGVQQASSWASVLGTGAALAGSLVTLVTWWLKRRAAVRQLANSDELASAAQELQAAVREQWRKEVEARSLGDPDPMPVRWRLSDPDVMDHPEHIVSSRLRFAGRSDRIPALTDQFRKLRRRRLVITGGPGSGKTTLAVQLLLQLLEGWQAGEQVPALFSLASWDPHTQPRVQDWLADQVSQTYPDIRAFGRDTAQRLADQGRLLPILDGLDEVPADRRGDVMDRLNASLHPDTGVILTSRTAEYTQTIHTCDVLTAAVVIEPESLTAGEAARYLEDRLPRRPRDSWQAVLTALRGGTAKALIEVVANPLGLWLLRTVYIDGRHDPQSLIDPVHFPDAAIIQHHLLDELIPAAVRGRPPLRTGEDPLRPQHQYEPEQVRRWLTTLALELSDANTQDWLWWHLARHTLTRRQIGLVFGLLVGVSSGLASGLGDALPGLGAVGSGLVGGLLLGQAGISAGQLHSSNPPVHIDLRIRGRTTDIGVSRTMDLGVKLVLGLVLGLVGGSLVMLVGGLVFSLFSLLGVGGLMSTLGFGPTGGLVGALRFGLVVGLIIELVVLIAFAASPSIAQRASSPAESLRGDRRFAVLVASTSALLAGLVGGFRLGLAFGLSAGLTGLVLGLVCGPIVSHTCWPVFVVASLWLGARKRLPWRLMRFLDDAYRLGLLRVVGPTYQFRHAALQDHLAPPGDAIAAAATDLSSPRRTR